MAVLCLHLAGAVASAQNQSSQSSSLSLLSAQFIRPRPLHVALSIGFPGIGFSLLCALIDPERNSFHLVAFAFVTFLSRLTH